MSIEKRLIKVLRGCVQDDSYIVGFDELLDNAIDSLTMINFVIGIEKEFDIEIDDEDLIGETLTTFRNIIKYVKSKI